MIQDLTELDSFGWAALKRALNQRVVIASVRFVPGKVNRVWIVETDVRPVVVKRFLSKGCTNEFESLLRARKAGLDVPFPISVEDNVIIMEFVRGDSCDRLINHMFSAKAAEGIGAWLSAYHGLHKEDGNRQLTGDAVLSNFIMSDDRVFGFDLEESKVGDPLEDLGQAAASILASEPFFTPIKFDLCLRLLQSYEGASGMAVMEAVRPFIAKDLRAQARAKPLFRRTFMAAAKTLENGWPKLAK